MLGMARRVGGRLATAGLGGAFPPFMEFDEILHFRAVFSRLSPGVLEPVGTTLCPAGLNGGAQMGVGQEVKGWWEIGDPYTGGACQGHGISSIP